MNLAPRLSTRALALGLLSACGPTFNKIAAIDADGDGYSSEVDCDDANATVYPGAEEVCGDGVVNDCEGDVASAAADCASVETLSLSGADLKLTGEARYDQAGAAIAGAGDVDGDGLADLLVGAPSECSGGSVAGAVYLLRGGGALGLASGVRSLSGADLKLIGETPRANAGQSVSGVGDVDGDGLDDLLIGAPGDTTAGRSAGAVYLLRGGGALEGASGDLSLSEADLKLTGASAHENAGLGVYGPGDVDGDGRADLLVGDWQNPSGSRERVAAQLLLGGGALNGASGTRSLADADLELTGDALWLSAPGTSVGAGDVDGDGRDDLLIAAGHAGFIMNSAAGYLLLGGGALDEASGALDLSDADLELSEDGSAYFPTLSAAGVGDVNGDGLDDLLIADVEEDSSRGVLYLVLGAGGGSGGSGARSLASADLTLMGEAEYDNSGSAISRAGDVDGDGLDDLLIGADGYCDASDSAGATYVLLGGGALQGASGTMSLAGADLKLTGEARDEEVGNAVAGVRDVDGDGFDDLLIGAARASTEAEYAGAAYLVLGGG